MGGYSGDAERCEKQCMLTVTQTPDVRPIISEVPFNISNVTTRRPKAQRDVGRSKEAAAEEHHRIAVEAEAKEGRVEEENARRRRPEQRNEG